jgi:hypothetical protein
MNPPSVVLHPQESPGKTGYSALVCISFYPLEEWQESALILLNLARTDHYGERFEQLWASSATTGKRFRHRNLGTLITANER